MTQERYDALKSAARACKTYAEAGAFLRAIELDETISDAAYYRLRDHAIDAAYNAAAGRGATA